MLESERLAAIARRDASVLITGESGTGKEVLARRLHAMSPRAGGPLMVVDCTTLRDTLFESQMFGHERGAFTGAERATLGFVRCAEGGTILLDEVGELDASNQARLLRVIQERRVTPLGSAASVVVNVRFMAATHRDLWAMAERGEFRADLLYRLDVVRVRLVPLRERADELPGLVSMLLVEIAESYGEDPASTHITTRAMARLRAHPWPGNVRELRNALEHGYVFAEPDPSGTLTIGVEHLPERLREGALESTGAGESDPRAIDLPGPGSRRIGEIKPLDEMERAWVRHAIAHTGGNKTRAAELLGISRNRLLRALAEV